MFSRDRFSIARTRKIQFWRFVIRLHYSLQTHCCNDTISWRCRLVQCITVGLLFQPYGVNMFGSYIKYTTTSTDGKLKYGSGKLTDATTTLLYNKDDCGDMIDHRSYMHISCFTSCVGFDPMSPALLVQCSTN